MTEIIEEVVEKDKEDRYIIKLTYQDKSGKNPERVSISSLFANKISKGSMAPEEQVEKDFEALT